MPRTLKSDQATFHWLYVSQLAAGCDFGVIKEIVGVARARNPTLGLTGALIFDGERFCQLLEGEREVVLATKARVSRDPRHAGLRTLVEAPASSGRVLSNWRSGYCEPTQLDAFDRASGAGGEIALAAFMTVLDSADME